MKQQQKCDINEHLEVIGIYFLKLEEGRADRIKEIIRHNYYQEDEIEKAFNEKKTYLSSRLKWYT